MKKYLKEYIKEMDEKINNVSKKELIELEESHLIKINFFQHERLIHLLVTLFYALFMIIIGIGSLFNNLLIFVFLVLLIFLIFYVLHYFFLENGVQYLYVQYDKIKEKANK